MATLPQSHDVIVGQSFNGTAGRSSVQDPLTKQVIVGQCTDFHSEGHTLGHGAHEKLQSWLGLR